LQIIKTEYNKVLLKCLDKVKQNIDQLGTEVKSRLAECEDIKFRNIEDIKLYLKESKLEKNKMDIENYLSKNKEHIENNKIINPNIPHTRSSSKSIQKSIQKKNTSNNLANSLATAKKEGRNNFFKEKEGNKTVDKKVKPINLMGSSNFEDMKKKFKIKDLNITNNFSTSNLKKKRELLIPLKINKKKIIKNNNILNEISNIEKPKNLKKNYFNTKQELSEADFQDFPFNLKKKENNNEKKEETPRAEESEDNDLNNPENEMDKQTKNNLIFQNIDFSKFVGAEKKFFLMLLLKLKIFLMVNLSFIKIKIKQYLI
jgi:hypothetical protein